MPKGSKWWKPKIAFGLNHFMLHSRKADGASRSDDAMIEKVSEDNLPSSSSSMASSYVSAPEPSSDATTSRAATSKDICAICLNSIRHDDGHALFTAECCHTFHFHCISSNVKHGNHVCPVCRAKEVNLQGLGSSDSTDMVRQPPQFVTFDLKSDVRSPSNQKKKRKKEKKKRSPSNISEPSLFNDDEPVDPVSASAENLDSEFTEKVEIKVYPEVSAIKRSVSRDDFAVLVHLRAPITSSRHLRHSLNSETSSAPLDLVTVLDVSGSMTGTKLTLLKRAMGFVIKNLGPADRLSVVAFSSTARRLFPLRRMSEIGRQQALQAVNDLVSGGTTNIAEGLRKGAKVIEERNHKNPICSIILLSDGHDTCSFTPSSVRAMEMHHIPVHTFGFGSDHDSNLLHAISEISGGTYSFIDTESVIQDAFAQCIGGLMSVAVQQLRVEAECVYPDVQICLIKSGSYTSCIASDKRSGSVHVGDLYVDEERDFLISINVPAGLTTREESEDARLLKVRCFYTNPVTQENIYLEEVEVKIQRPEEILVEPTFSIEVDRQMNRLQATQAMTNAKEAAEIGLLSEAVEILKNSQQSLAESISMKSGDSLCKSLDVQLNQMQENMVSQQTYRSSGRAHMLSHISLYSAQRANLCGNWMGIDLGDSDEMCGSALPDLPFQTPRMRGMVRRSRKFSD